MKNEIKEIEVGQVVAFKDTKGDREKNGYYKGIPVDEVYECQDKWYAAWTQTESYMCM